MPDPTEPTPTDETPRTAASIHADPLVGALTDLATIVERFSGRLEANEKADDELRQAVVRLVEQVSERNQTLKRIEAEERRRADAAERGAAAESERLDLARQEQAERAATAAARWRAISDAATGYASSVLKHPVTVAVGGALLFGLAQTISAKFGFNVADYMSPSTKYTVVEESVHPIESAPEPSGPIPEVEP